MATCGIIAQHAWELPDYQNTNEKNGHSMNRRFTPYLHRLITEQGIRRFLVSMDLGPALDAAEAVLALKKQSDITLDCILPYEDLHSSWTELERNRFFAIMGQCDHELIFQRKFSLDCYKKCNEKIISESPCLLILWNGNASDAGDALSLAEKQGRQVTVLNAVEFAACQET